MTPANDGGPRWLDMMRASPLARVAAIGVFILALQIPIAMISRLVGERERNRGSAIAEVSAKWGRAQQVFGPMLLVRYAELACVPEDASQFGGCAHHATFLPEELGVVAELRTELRYRGIFEVPVYRATVQIRGRFSRPDLSALGLDPEHHSLEEAQVVLELGDARRIRSPVRLAWNDTQLDFAAGTGWRTKARPGIHAPVPAFPDSSAVDFAIDLSLDGSSHFGVAPLGRETSVRMEGDWPDPSFQGAWLPNAREVGPEGFEASWAIPHLGRDYPQAWHGDGHPTRVGASAFGVDLLSPVDAYRATRRSLKYQLLFLALTFLTLWLLEVLAEVRVHPIQYGLIGTAMCLFYLLELSLAEHLGLALAYGLATAAVVGLVGAYATAVLASRVHGALVASVVAALYLYLYVLLRIQSYALLLGSLGLFAILAAVMYATRNVDWYSLGPRPR